MTAFTRYPEPLVFGLDIGTRSIVGTVGYMEQDKFNVVAMTVRYHDTRSMIDGQIHDIAKVSEDIVFVKNELEKQLGGRKLKDVCIAAAGRVLKTAVGHGNYEFEENTVISQEYIHAIDLIGVEKAHDIILEELNESRDATKYYCVGYTVIKYYLNDYEIHNLEGHKGTRIGADVLATFLPEEVVSSLYTAVEAAGLFVTNLTLEPIAAIKVAIPEQFRLLNIALVDVGAGTSDICITRDGSITGYGMIPSAGDELTEAIVKKYLVDFDTAEKLKTAGPKRKSISYKDIMGISHKLTPADILDTLDEIRTDITSAIAEKIIELNGGEAVSAVFIVGGGGKLSGFSDHLAGALGLAPERVALRGQEVMNNINFLIDDIKKDSLYVTPIGICLNYFEQKNNFIFVTVNGERVKLYNNDRLTIFDAAVQYGLPNESLFPKRGDDITFKINEKTRIVRGYDGEAAVIRQNGRISGMNSQIKADDRIEIEESTKGEAAKLKLENLPEYNGTINVTVNDISIECPKFAVVNGRPESQLYEIHDGDEVLMQNFYTLEQLLVMMDENPEGIIYVNNIPAGPDTKIYDNFSVSWSTESSDYDTDEPVEYEKPDVNPAENKPLPESADIAKTVNITVNNTPVTMKGKSAYTFVDIFDYYPFDLSKVGGTRLITNINGSHAEYIAPLDDGDNAEIYWES